MRITQVVVGEIYRFSSSLFRVASVEDRGAGKMAYGRLVSARFEPTTRSVRFVDLSDEYSASGRDLDAMGATKIKDRAEKEYEKFVAEFHRIQEVAAVIRKAEKALDRECTVTYTEKEELYEKFENDMVKRKEYQTSTSVYRKYIADRQLFYVGNIFEIKDLDSYIEARHQSELHDILQSSAGWHTSGSVHRMVTDREQSATALLSQTSLGMWYIEATL